MRITGGVAGGRILKVPKGLDVRPTPDLVKQAIFNSLGERVVGARLLELFAGSGALTLEGFSRGAVAGVCVELSRRHAKFIRENFATAGFAGLPLDVRVKDVFSAIKQLVAAGAMFDLILADPPYGPKNVAHRSESFAQQLLDDKALPSLLTERGLFVLGHTKRDSLELTPAWHERKLMRHGDTVMRFLQPACISSMKTSPTRTDRSEPH